jgi:hypothetical protein
MFARPATWLCSAAARRALVLVAVTGVVLMYGGTAFADAVVDELTVAGTDTFTAPGFASVRYKINSQNNDGQTGCNASDGSAASLTLHSSPSGVTAKWSDTGTATSSYTTCGTFKAAQLSSSTPGDYQITVTVGDSGTGTYSVAGATFTLHVLAGADTIPPVLTLPPDQTVEATSPGGVAVTYPATAFDAGDNGSTAVSCTPASGSVFPIGATTVSCTSADTKNNTTTGSFKVTVQDTTAPALSLSDQSAEATGPNGAAVSYTATASDVVDGSRPLSCTPASSSTFPIGASTVSCSASDTRGNTASGSFTVTVRDTTAPSLTLTDQTVEATGPGGAAVSYTASANDTVDGELAVSCDKPSGGVFPVADTEVTCSATDNAGNKASGSFTIAVGDHTAPALTLTDSAAEATGPDGADVTYSANANDTVDGIRAVDCAPGYGGTFPLGTTTVHCSASDTRGNTAMGSLVVTVQDSTPPKLTLTDEVDEATGPDGAVVTYTATAADLVDGAVAVTCDRPSGGKFPLGTSTVSCSATDKHGNTGTGGFTVTVHDTTAPALSLANQQEEATGPAGAPVSYPASAKDLVDGAVPVSCDKASSSTFPLGETKVTCSTADTAGNEATDSFTVTVVDTTAPVLTLADTTAEATAPDGAVVTYDATAKDAVDGDVPVTCTPASGTKFALGTTPVSCSASDGRHNFAKDGFDVSVVDTTPPALVLTDATAEATGPNGATVSYLASAADVVDGAVAVSCDKPSGGTFPLGTTTVTCSTTDQRGNTGIGSFTVKIQDTTAPELELTDQVAEATGPDGAAVTYAPTAEDMVSGDRPVACDKGSGSTFPLGTTHVACAATDAAGNRADGTFTVTVGDHTAPSLRLSDKEAEATGPDGANSDYTASATDIVDGPRPIDCSPASGSVFPLGATAVDCSSSDTRGNSATGRLTVTVKDTTPPALTLHDETAEATGPTGAAVTYRATGTDIVDGTVAVSCDRPSGGTFPLGIATVNCTATDQHGNTGTGTLTVTVQDTVAPVLALSDKLAEATGPNGTVVAYTVSAQDVVDGNVPVACDEPSGGTFPLDSTSVTCSAKDKSGNTATDSFKVTVVDTTAPVIGAQDQTVEATSASGAVAGYTATATDLVDGTVSVTCSPASGSTFKIGVTDATCSAADTRGNADSATFHITVQDTTAPKLTLPADISTTAASALGAKATYIATAADLVDSAPKVTCTPGSGSTFAPGVTTVTCTATDATGNSSAAQTFKVNVAYAWSNLLQPINTDNSSVFKLGSTVPVKFQLNGGSAGTTNLPARLYYARISNSTPGTYLEATSTSAADSGNTFRYDAAAGQYIFNLSTKNWSEGLYQLSVDLGGDGIPHTVKITIKK